MMDKELTIKSLKYFAASNTEDIKAKSVIEKKYTGYREILLGSNDYYQIKDLFDYIEIILFRVKEQACEDLIDFINLREDANIELPDDHERLRNYCTNADLQALAIKQLSRLRYIEKCQNKVIETLFNLSTHSEEKVKKQALSGLESFVHLEISVYKQAGMQPQLKVLEYILAMEKDEVLEKQDAVFMAAGQFFSPLVQNYVWHPDSVEINSGSVPADDETTKLRSESLEFVKCIYSYNNSISWKRRCLSALQSAKSLNSYRVKMSDETIEMINQNAVAALEFIKSLVPLEPLQIIQKIERDSYWTYYHYFKMEMGDKALEIEKAIKEREDYNIYRDLVGFEGIYEDWETRRKANNRINDISAEREEREQRVFAHAQSVTEENFAEWQTKIIEFLGTESDDLATFPHMFSFLKELARLQPKLMFDFLVSDIEKLDKALIVFIVGLWETEKHDDLKALLLSWIAEKKYLYVTTKIFLAVTPEEEILQPLFNASTENEETALYILPMLIASCAEFFEKGHVEIFAKYFVPSIQRLSECKNANWLHEVWFKQNIKEMLEALNEDDLKIILDNLIYANTIDFHSETILSIIADRMPEEVILFFGSRLAFYREKLSEKSIVRYEPIPFDLNTVDEVLARHPDICVGIVRSWFDGHESMFEYDGGKLLNNIFPFIGGDYELELTRLVTSEDEQNIKFVINMLKAYDGNDSIFRITKEIVKVLPEGHELLNSLKVAIWSSGVLRGEYGMADMLKSKADKIAEWAKDENSKVRKFGEQYSSELANEADARRQQADEEIQLRKHKYGEE